MARRAPLTTQGLERSARPLRRRCFLRLAAAASLAPVASGCQTRPVALPTRPAAAKRIAYGDDRAQFVELTLPSGVPKGVVVVVHGGFWKAAYDIEYGRPLAASLAEHGWAAWNVEYRRVGNGGGDLETFDDVAAAIDALHGQDLDLTRVLGLGHSAGGHLVTWAASRGRFPRWRARVHLTGVVSQAGVLDLTAAFEDNLGDGAVVAFLGHRPGRADVPLDPMRQVPLDIPVHCIHGTDDTVVPVSQSRGYVTDATAAGATAALTEVAGDHFVLIDPKSHAWEQTLAILDGL
jgi:acetyl esterase/lipase